MHIFLLILLLIPNLALADQHVTADQPFTLGWTPATNAEGYEVEQSINGGEYIPLHKVTEPTTQTSLADKEEATYRVRGYMGTGDSYEVGVYSDESDLFIGFRLLLEIEDAPLSVTQPHHKF